jgi:hypothetical protein
MKPIFSSEGLHCTDCLEVVTPYEKLSSFQKECEKGNQECLPVWCKECRDKIKESKSKNLLWLDDLRNPFEGKWIEEFAPEYLNSGSIIWVLNYEEFIEWIRKNGLPKKICFDHDLGEDVAIKLVSKGVNKKKAREAKKLAKSGYDCAKWLVDYCIDHDLQIPDWNIQSANPVGKENINGLLINAKKHLAKNP